MAWEHMACHINNFDHDPTLSGYRMMKHWQKSFDLPHRYFVKILPRFEELFKSYYWPNCGCIWKIQSFYTICSTKSRWLPWKLSQLCHIVNANNIFHLLKKNLLTFNITCTPKTDNKIMINLHGKTNLFIKDNFVMYQQNPTITWETT